MAAAFVAAVFLLCADWACAQGLVEIPALRSPVTDLTGTLTPDQAAALEAKLRAFEASKGSQLAVLVVPTTQPEAIEQFAIRVADAWKLGRTGVDDGAILIVAKDDRKLRVEVGYGLEGALPDATANRIIDEVIVPRFRDGDFYGGISAGVDRMLRVIEGEPLPEPRRESPAHAVPGLFTLLPFLFMFALVGGSIFRRMFGRVGGAFATGGLVGFFTWLLVGILGVSLVAGILAFVFALVGGLGGGGGPGPGGNGWYSRRHDRGWGHPGGWGGGGFSGGGGFGGGWSGGGGGFGGGGASGSW
jgi:uncharacterized protein